MKTTQIRKLALLAMVLTVGLAGLAVGYGHWQDSLNIHIGTDAVVGDLCFGFIEPECLDGPGTDDYTCDVADCAATFHQLDSDPNLYPDEIAKDVGQCIARLDLEPGEEPPAESVSVTIDTAYPCYAAKAFITMTNCGDSDVLITAEFIRLPDWMQDLGYYFHYVSPEHGTPTKMGFIMKEVVPGQPDPSTDPKIMEVWFIDFEGETIHPGPFGRVTAELLVHVLQEAEQNTQYAFNIDIAAWAQ
jgi:hypothetical protein